MTVPTASTEAAGLAERVRAGRGLPSVFRAPALPATPSAGAGLQGPAVAPPSHIAMLPARGLARAVATFDAIGHGGAAVPAALPMPRVAAGPARAATRGATGAPLPRSGPVPLPAAGTHAPLVAAPLADLHRPLVLRRAVPSPAPVPSAPDPARGAAPRQAALLPVLQRQPQPAAAATVARLAEPQPAAPSTLLQPPRITETAAQAAPARQGAAPDLEALVERACSRLFEQMTLEQQRRGVSPWL